jgi:hypothetical protein
MRCSTLGYRVESSIKNERAETLINSFILDDEIFSAAVNGGQKI